MNTFVLANVEKWNYDKATALYRQHVHVNNHDRQEAMLGDFARLSRNGDKCRRAAFLLSHTKEGKRG